MSSYGSTLEVSDSVADTLRAAYYYGFVDGHAVVGPALVLVAAARNDKAVALSVLGAAMAEARPLLAADVSTRASRQAGSAETAATRVPALREARWWVLRDAEEEVRARRATVGTDVALRLDTEAPVWDAEVAMALERAAGEAVAAGAGRIGVAALLVGLLRSAHPGVQALAKAANLDIAAATSGLDKHHLLAPEKPFTPLIGLLTMAGVIDRGYPLLMRWIPALFRRIVARQEAGGGPVMIILEMEILRQAVITGHTSVQAAHLPLAIVSMQEQLTAHGGALAAPYRQFNQGGLILSRRGIDLRAAQQAVENLPHDDDVLTPTEVERLTWSTGKLGDPSWTHPAATAMDHAAAIARRHQHRDTGTTHLLAAVLTDAESTASLLLESLGINTASLRDDLDQQLATPPGGGPGMPG